MGLVEKKNLISSISPPVDQFLATQLVDEFVSMEKRYIQRDWEPTELDGGQFAEILARTIYHLDSGNLNLSKSFDDCHRYIDNEQVPHSLQPRSNAKHLFAVIKTIYKFRSDRGAVHISPTYTANHMDSKFLIESVRWSMNEALRLWSRNSKDEVAKQIRELLQFDVPSIGNFEGVVIVQRTNLKCDQELLLLLHYAGEKGYSRKELGRHCQKSPTSITLALQELASPNKKQIIQLPNSNYRLTDLGSKHIRENLSDQLLLN